MPTYEYRCQDCGHGFEEWLRAAREEKNVRCPKCDSRQLERQHSVFAAHAAAAPSPPPGPCGNCGQADGACPFG